VEIGLKVVVTVIVLVVVYYQAIFLGWMWRSQVDPKETVARVLKTASPDSAIIATRDSKALYQNGKVVAKVTGDVDVTDNAAVFSQLSDTCGLDRNLPFEYKRDKFKIVKVRTVVGLSISASQSGTENLRDVLEHVECKRMP